MKILAVMLALAAAFSGCVVKTNGTAGTNGGDVWQPLFNGKNTNGWHTFNQKSIGSAWKVEDGALHLDASQKENWQTKGGGDIICDAEFENFHLQLEWKIAKNGNSGIIFYAQEAPQYKYAWETGLEMQVLDNQGHADGKIRKHRAGDLYDLLECSQELAKGPGEWNKVDIICQKGSMQFMMNGETVVETTLWDDNWKAMVAASKFKDMPGWGSFKKGKIALQDHGDDVWYRNIRIKRL